MRVKLLDPRAKAPTCEYPGFDLGYDLYALEDMELLGHTPTKVRTGIVVEFLPLWGGIIKDRSSMASRGVTTSGGVIDSGYRGEIVVIMTYLTPKGDIYPWAYRVKAGDKIAQIVPQKIYTWDSVDIVDELSPSDRGEKGFGSSGR